MAEESDERTKAPLKAPKWSRLLRLFNVVSLICFFPLLLPSCMLLVAGGGPRVDSTGVFVMAAIIGFPFLAVLAPTIGSNMLFDRGHARLALAVGAVPVIATLSLLVPLFRN